MPKTILHHHFINLFWMSIFSVAIFINFVSERGLPLHFFFSFFLFLCVIHLWTPPYETSRRRNQDIINNEGGVVQVYSCSMLYSVKTTSLLSLTSLWRFALFWYCLSSYDKTNASTAKKVNAWNLMLPWHKIVLWGYHHNKKQIE